MLLDQRRNIQRQIEVFRNEVPSLFGFSRGRRAARLSFFEAGAETLAREVPATFGGPGLDCTQVGQR